MFWEFVWDLDVKMSENGVCDGVEIDDLEAWSKS